jgi:hypothetical protein
MSMQGWQETLITAQSDGAAVTAAAATTLLPAHAKYTLAPNFFSRLGQKLRIKATGRISSLITTPGTARFDVRFGATVVFDGLAILLDTVAAHTNVGWWLEIEMTLRAVGATANLMGQGFWTCEDILGVPAAAPKGVLSAMLPWNSAPAVGNNFDSGASQQVDLFFTQTAATGSITLHTFELISAN